MFDRSWTELEMKSFKGAVLDPPVARISVRSPNGVFASNVEFDENSVGKRLGFAQVLNPGEGSYGFFNWLGPNGNLLVYKRISNGRVRWFDITANPPSPADLIASDIGGHAPIFADNGTRLFTCSFDTSFRGGSSGFVSSKPSGGLVSDQLFPPPMSYVPGAPTEPSAGVVTAGAHRLAYQIEFRHGYFAQPSPNSATTSTLPTVVTFAPVTFTSAGLKNLSWVLNPSSWPTGAVNVYIIMTTVSNPQRFFRIPGTQTSVPGGSSGSKTIVWNISDDDVIARGIDVTDSLFQWCQTPNGTAPFNPFTLCVYGDRLVYLTSVLDSTANVSQVQAYASDRNAYQVLSQDQHLVPIPKIEFRACTPIGRVLYFFGPNWTYGVMDNGDVPATWSAAELIDADKGTLTPRGVAVSSNGSYIWVADKGGLYYFDGRYSARPISWLQSGDWSRIRWDYAHMLEVIEHPEKHLVIVKAVLDSNTNPSHLLVWNYKNGTRYDQADYAIWTLGGSFAPGAAGMVQNDLFGAIPSQVKQQELWLTSSAAADIWRQKGPLDTNPYRDGSGAFSFTWASAPIPGVGGEGVMRHGGFEAALTGNGTLTPQLYSHDDAAFTNLSPITLSNSPGRLYTLLTGLLTERAHLSFSMSGLDDWFRLSWLKYYLKPWLKYRSN